MSTSRLSPYATCINAPFYADSICPVKNRLAFDAPSLGREQHTRKTDETSKICLPVPSLRTLFAIHTALLQVLSMLLLKFSLVLQALQAAPAEIPCAS
jgi:hypothetical protein